MRCLLERWAAMVLAGMATVVVARAQSVGGGAVVQITDPRGTGTDSYNLLSNVPADMLTLRGGTVQSSYGAGEATASIAGQMGTLKAKTFATYSGAPERAAAQAHVQVSSLDYLTVSSGTLAAGTPVRVSFRMALSGTFTTTKRDSHYFSSAVASTSMSGGSASSLLRYDNATDGAPFDLVGSVDAKVGERLTFINVLDTFSYVSAYSTLGNSASVDFYSTARSFAWSENPAVDLISASGHDYAPVPEPASMAALGLGLVALARRRR